MCFINSRTAPAQLKTQPLDGSERLAMSAEEELLSPTTDPGDERELEERGDARRRSWCREGPRREDGLSQGAGPERSRRVVRSQTPGKSRAGSRSWGLAAGGNQETSSRQIRCTRQMSCFP